MSMTLKTKIFILVFLSLVLATVPAALISSSALRETVMQAERHAFNALSVLMEEQLQQRYMNLQRAEVLDVSRLKESMVDDAHLVERLWPLRAQSTVPAGQMDVMALVLGQVRENGAVFDVYGQGKMHMSTPLWLKMVSNLDREDFKGDTLRSMLAASLLPRKGVFAVFVSEDKSDLEQDLGAGISAMLALFYPLGDQVICIAAPLVNWQRWDSYRNEILQQEVQYKLDVLGKENRVSMGIISAQGKIMASSSTGKPVVVQCIPEEIFALAEKNKTAEYVEGRHIDTAVHQGGSQGVLYHVTFIRSLKWFLIAAVELSTLEESGAQLSRRLGLVGLVAWLLSLLGAGYLAARFTRPLDSLTRKAQAFAARDFSSPVATQELLFAYASPTAQGAEGRHGDEVERLSSAFAHMEASLHSNIHNLIALTASTERIQGELDAARQIQRGILPLPKDMAPQSRVTLAALLEPAKEVGGDFYDFMPLPDGRLAVVIGDVSDKGVPAALFMSMVVTLVRSALSRGMEPAAILAYVNASLCAHNPQNMFVTLWVGILNPESGDLVHANGGHCLPLIVGRAGQDVREIETLSGLVVGMLPDQEYVGATLRLNKDVLVLLYSDGVTEAMNASGELFGLERLQQCMMTAAHATPEALQSYILAQIGAFRGTAEQSDDITMLCLRWWGAA